MGLTKREVLLAAAAAVVLSVLMNWPLVLHLGHTVPRDLGDPLPQAWQAAWDGFALVHQPLHFFQANQFWPAHDSLAYSDALLGYAPLGLIGSGPEAAIFRYDVLFLFAYALCFFGAYLLARELGLPPVAAAIAGAAFAFAPFRLEQDGHMQVISSGGIAVALALAVRGFSLRKPLVVFGAWLVAAWQFSIGPTLGLPFTYLLALLAAIAFVIWWRRGRPAIDRRLAVATIAGAVVYLAFAAVIAQPYLRIADRQPDAQRSAATVEAYSDGPRVFALAPEENMIWAGASDPIRDRVQNPQEKSLFPGLTILALALAGLGAGALKRGLRTGLALGVVGTAILSLGFDKGGGWLWPDRIAYELLPGWDGIRTPGRIFTFTSLALALLAAAGTWRLLTALRERRGGFWTAGPAAALAVVLVLVIATEGRGLPFDPTHSRAQPRVPDAPPDVSDAPAPQLHLPARTPEDNRRYLLWSTDGFPKLVNGRSSTQPALTTEIFRRARSFPDRASVDYLRSQGVRSVIVHLDRLGEATRNRILGAPAARLGLTRTTAGPLLIFDLDP